MIPVRDKVKKNVQTITMHNVETWMGNEPFFNVKMELGNPVKSIVWSTVNLRVWDKVYDTR